MTTTSSVLRMSLPLAAIVLLAVCLLSATEIRAENGPSGGGACSSEADCHAPGGTCVAGTCQCNLQYQGMHCQACQPNWQFSTATGNCFIYVPNPAPCTIATTCNGAGLCLFDGTCHCTNGSTNADCSMCPNNNFATMPAGCTMCKPDFFGPTCSDQCSSCNSHGTTSCDNSASAAGGCQCRAGYVGPSCACDAATTCNGNGVCVNGACQCTGNFTGERCDQCKVVEWTGSQCTDLVTSGVVSGGSVASGGDVTAVGAVRAASAAITNTAAVGSLSVGQDASGLPNAAVLSTGDAIFGATNVASLTSASSVVAATQVQAASVVASGAVTAQSLTLANASVHTSGDATVQQLTATSVQSSGPITGGSLVQGASLSSQSGISGDHLNLSNASVASSGDATFHHVSATSIGSTGNVVGDALVQGASLSAQGAVTAQSLTLANAAVHTSGDASVKQVTATGVESSGPIVGAVLVQGASLSSQGDIRGQTLTLANASVDVSGAASVHSLSVGSGKGIVTDTGAASFQSVNANSGTIETTGQVSAGTAVVSGKATAGSLHVGPASISSTGVVTGTSLVSTGDASVTGTATVGHLVSTGSVTGATVSSTGNVEAAQKVTAASVEASGAVSSSSLSVSGAANAGSLTVGAGAAATVSGTGAAVFSSVDAGASLRVGAASVQSSGNAVFANVSTTGTISSSGGVTAETFGLNSGAANLAASGVLSLNSVAINNGSAWISSTGGSLFNAVNAASGSMVGGSGHFGFLSINGGQATILSSGRGEFTSLSVDTSGDLTAGSASFTSLTVGSSALIAASGAANFASIDLGSGQLRTTGAVNAATITSSSSATVGGNLSVQGVGSFNGGIRPSDLAPAYRTVTISTGTVGTTTQVNGVRAGYVVISASTVQDFVDLVLDSGDPLRTGVVVHLSNRGAGGSVAYVRLLVLDSNGNPSALTINGAGGAFLLVSASQWVDVVYSGSEFVVLARGSL